MKKLWFLWTLSIMIVLAYGINAQSQNGKKKSTKKNKPKTTRQITVDAHIMSHCPYGVRAIEPLVSLAEDFKKDLKITLYYIGNTKEDGTLSSMHGDKEIQGNIDQLCAKDTALNQSAYWKYIQCVNENWREIPSNSIDCAKEAKLKMKKFTRCSSGKKGKKLLTASFEKSRKVKANGSPTFFINGEKYEGNRSKAAFAQYICATYNQSKKLKACENIEPPATVKMFALTDKRCGEKCDTKNMIANLKGIFMGLEAEEIDWSESRAKKIAKNANIQKLPALLFTESIKKDEEGHKYMERWLTKAGDYYRIKTKAVFDPTAEICNNGIDDTKNGKIDCKDKTCKNTLTCREQTPKQLELFVMSQCPYGAMAVNAMGDVLDAFGKDINFKIHYIASQTSGKITSMHGQAEVDEDIRWLCAQKYYPNNEYLKYVWCRAQDYKSSDWKACATGPIKAAVIQKCFESGEGEKMLQKDLKIAEGLDIGASPSWIANGQTKFSGVTPKSIQDNFCKANTGLKGCETPLSDQRVSKAPAGACGN